MWFMWIEIGGMKQLALVGLIRLIFHEACAYSTQN